MRSFLNISEDYETHTLDKAPVLKSSSKVVI